MKDKRSSIKDHRAVKILSKAYMEAKDMQSFKNEVSCLKQLEHPNVVRMHHFYEDPKRFLLITDVSSGGDLFARYSDDGKLDTSEAAVCIKQVLSAVRDMHQPKTS